MDNECLQRLQPNFEKECSFYNNKHQQCCECCQQPIAARSRSSHCCSCCHATSSVKTYTKNSTLSMQHSASLSLLRVCSLLVICSTLFSSAYGCGPGRGIGGPRRHRKLIPLVFKQHVPNMSEKTLGASGVHEDSIRRDSPKFKNLVPNYNKNIIFKDEEGTGADRLMTRRCKDKLNTLAVSVMNHWPGVLLRVTESWDEDNAHGSESLHYEGRAVDITTSDRDRTKYGMLARLAVEAGFDWVYFESRAYIHCSVKSDSSHTNHISGCFSTDSTVLTESGQRKLMSDVVIGDRLLSMSSSGEAIYSQVLTFMDRNLQLVQDFVHIRTDGGAILSVTPAHLIMVWNPEKQLRDYVFADRIEIGDFVLVHDSHGDLTPQKVVDLKAVQKMGVVAPLTAEGTIVVNSVAASCYAIVDSQNLAHWSMAPLRLLAKMQMYLPFGSSSSSSNGNTNSLNILPRTNHTNIIAKAAAAQTTAQQQNGVHWYAKALYSLKDYVLPKSWSYQ